MISGENLTQPGRIEATRDSTSSVALNLQTKTMTCLFGKYRFQIVSQSAQFLLNTSCGLNLKTQTLFGKDPLHEVVQTQRKDHKDTELLDSQIPELSVLQF